MSHNAAEDAAAERRPPAEASGPPFEGSYWVGAESDISAHLAGTLFAEVSTHLNVPVEVLRHLEARGQRQVISTLSRIAGVHIAHQWPGTEDRSVERQVSAIGPRLLRLQGQLDRIEASVDELRAEKSNLHYSTWLTMVAADGRQLGVTAPIPVVVQELDGEWMASWLEADVKGLGDDLTEALIGFQRELIDLFNDLTSTPEDELGPLPMRWLRLLRQHLT